MMATKQEVYQWWINKGYRPHEAAALTGNFVAESGLDSTISNKQGSGAFGTAQWLGSRKKDLFNFAKESGKDPTSIDTQLEFADYELHGKESNALKKLQATDNVADATYAVAKYYERPSDKEIAGSIGKRTNVAEGLVGSGGEGSSEGAGGSGEDDPLTLLKTIRLKKTGGNTNIPKPILEDDEDPAVLLQQLRTSKLKVTDNTTPETVDKSVGDKVFDTIGSVWDTVKKPVGFVANSAAKSVAANADTVLNTPENIVNLEKAGWGYVLGELGVPEKYLPEVTTPTNVIANKMSEKGIISTNPEYNPTSTTGKITDSAIQGGVGYLLGGGANSLKAAGKNLLTGATMGGTAEAVTEATDNPLIGSIAGVVAPAIISKGASAVTNNPLTRGVGSITKKVSDELPFYTAKGARNEAAKRLYEQVGETTGVKELPSTTFNRLSSGIKTLRESGSVTPETEGAAVTAIKKKFGAEELQKAPDTFVHQNPEAAAAGLGALVGHITSGSPFTGGLLGYVFKGTAKKVVDNLTEKQNKVLQNAIDTGILHPETLQKAFEKLEPKEVETFIQKLEKLNTPEGNVRIGMALNRKQDEEETNKLTEKGNK